MWSGEQSLELGDVVGISIQYYLPLDGSGELSGVGILKVSGLFSSVEIG